MQIFVNVLIYENLHFLYSKDYILQFIIRLQGR